ncbi:Ig-like domain-containing protein [Hymenobacter convexus]|uniref:Ig-like domain-containing protein n=1 Tax=Hymenobacter sp. CA1UV-4 TaxID=3063782 RepID=UPI002712F54A|nr:T9SS type A sorting domain-containing protein [Hymenobacter sp. CA1UV-4]MDO7854485.1 T9SS type A sorting domain-containing protein [Hymenobacter sp. CA1UV-4]
MNKLFTLLSSLGLLLLLLPLISYAQPSACSNQITVSYYDNGVLKTTTVNNGQSGSGAAVCPVAGAQYTFSASSTADAVLTWSRVISRGTTSANDVVEPVSTANAPAGTVLAATVSFTTSTEFRIRSDANSYPGSKCNKDGFLYMTFNPTLTLAASGTSATAGVCAGASVTLTAAGATSGGYTWKANGTTLAGQNNATLTVAPTATTTYTVEATTSCGQSSQQITIPVKDVTIAPAAPAICPSQSTTLTASYTGISATYQWFVKGQSTLLSSTNTLTVTPGGTTTYQVVATTADCSTITREATVTVGPQTLSVSTGPAAAICPGGSTTLTATSDNPAATFTWSPGTGLNATTGATVTASPTASTTYTVTATTPCGVTATKQVAVSIVSPTFSITPNAPSTCAGDAVTLTASSGGLTGTTYRWYKSTDLGTVLATMAALTAKPAANTTYRVDILTPCSTTPNTQNATVTVNAKPALAISPTSTTVDYGTSTTLTASGGGPYTWTATTGSTTTTLAATTASITVTPVYTTTYAATASNAAGCSATVQSLVTVTRPLPVELVSFEAGWDAKTPVLTWATASEKNSAYFDIERSANGETFKAVGRVAAAGNASARTNYQFRDQNLGQPAAGLLYYRLHQVDLTGEDTYSLVQSLETAKTASAFEATVYPNPFDSKVAVQLFTLKAAAATLTLHNLMGQTLLTRSVTLAPGTQDIALPEAEQLPAGVYYLTVRQGSNQQVLRLSHR